MRVLISGAGGFVGGHLAVTMARNGHDVVALVRRTRSAILETQKHIRIEQADLAAETASSAGGSLRRASSLRRGHPERGTGRNRADEDQCRRLVPSVRTRGQIRRQRHRLLLLDGGLRPH